jgi:hypothetical protein
VKFALPISNPSAPPYLKADQFAVLADAVEGVLGVLTTAINDHEDLLHYGRKEPEHSIVLDAARVLMTAASRAERVLPRVHHLLNEIADGIWRDG